MGTMRQSGTVTEIWHLKDNEVTTLFLRSRDVIGHVTIRLLGVDFLWVVHRPSDSYGETAPQMLDARTWRWKERRKKRKRKGEKRRERRRGSERKKWCIVNMLQSCTVMEI